MTAPISSIDLFNLLRQKVGENEAKALADFVTSEVERKFEDTKIGLATKDDIHRLDTKVSDKFGDLLKWMIVLFAPFYIGMIVFLIKQFL